MNGNNAPFGPALIYTGIAPFAEAEANADANEVPFQMLDSADAKAMDFIAFGQGERKVSLLTGGLSPVFDAMNTCTLDLIRSWGLDPDKHRTKTRSPIWKNPMVIAGRVQDYYPDAGFRRGQRAMFKLRVIIDEAGDVIECKLDKVTVANRVDSPACRIFRNAKFEPALDADGQPMKSYYTTTLKYYMD